MHKSEQDQLKTTGSHYKTEKGWYNLQEQSAITPLTCTLSFSDTQKSHSQKEDETRDSRGWLQKAFVSLRHLLGP